VSPKRWTIKELLEVTADYLKKKEIDSPRLCAEVLLSHQLNINRVKLYLALDQPLNEGEISGYRSLIKRRLDREPIQHITGVQEFWSMEFIVGPQVLIPRPESELLIEQIILIYKAEGRMEQTGPTVLDLGTGSGALAVSLARELKSASVWASDISPEALDIARKNSKRHGVEERIQFIHGDLWQPFKEKNFTFDFIVSNPPYIALEDYDSLAPEVRDYEPRLALDGHNQGMFYIEKIIMGGADYLNPGGWLLIEMDPGQTPKAIELMEKSSRYSEKSRIRDYSGNYRVVMSQKALIS